MLGLRPPEANGRLVWAREQQAVAAMARQSNRDRLARRQPAENRLVIRQNLAEPPPGVHSNSLALSARQRFRLRLFPFCARHFFDLMLEDKDPLLVADDDIGVLGIANNADGDFRADA